MQRLRREQIRALRSGRIRRGMAQAYRDAGMSAEADPSTNDLLIGSAGTRPTRLSFDQEGWVSTIRTPMGLGWKLAHDPEGRLTELTNPAGSRLDFYYTADGKVSRIGRDSRVLFEFGYGETEAPVKVSYLDGTTTLIGYESHGRPSQIVDRLGNSESYTYDGAGRLISIQDPNQNKTGFQYRAGLRPYFLRYADGTFESYEYDPAGRLQMLSCNGEPIARIAYDDAGHAVEMRFGDGTSSSYVYDDQGRLTEARAGGSVVSYQYDERGRVIKEDQNGLAVGYEYTGWGALCALVYPSGARVEFEYDDDHRLSAVRDWKGDKYEILFEHGDRGMAVQYPNGLASVFRFSSTGLVNSIHVRPIEPGNQDLCSFHYRYDDENRVSVFQDSRFGTRAYKYDAEGQLVSVVSEHRNNTENFWYDAAGNRLVWIRQKAEFNALNQLVSQGHVRCGYDHRGNLVSRLTRNRGRTFTYNSRNQMIRAEDTYGGWVEFGYDAFGRRIWKRHEQGGVRYVWAGEQLIGEISVDTAGERPREYLYIPGTFTPLATRVADSVYYYHTDHLGTPRLITDRECKTVWSADYAAFGHASIQTASITNNLRYPGHYYDDDTQLHYNRFRYYCPGLGRYQSRDPMSYLAGLNFYTYAENDPINGCDPMGLWNWKPIIRAAAPPLAAVAVGTAVIALAPSLPLVVATGALAGATGPLVSDLVAKWVDHKDFCLPCTLKKMGLGAAAGALGALIAAPLAGVAGRAVGGAIGSSLQYAADVFSQPHPVFHPAQLIAAAAAGGLLGSVTRDLKLQPVEEEAVSGGGEPAVEGVLDQVVDVHSKRKRE